jgi:membrane associated rhomboid family serine protease
MEETNPQRAPGPGMTRLRHGDRTWEMPDPVWELWVRRGHVPPDALVLSEMWTRGVWRRAEGLEIYHLYRPPTAEERAAAMEGRRAATRVTTRAGAGPLRSAQASFGTATLAGEAEAAGAREAAITGVAEAGITGAGGSDSMRRAAHDLPEAIWGPGLSVTQVLVLANLLVSGALVWVWREDYDAKLWALSGILHARLFAGSLPAIVVPLFLHASAGHLLGNMVGLTAGGAAVEEFYGRLRTLGLYLLAGLCGAAMSLLRARELYPDTSDIPVPVLTVGASGAIMGLYGVILVFLLRYRARFSERQRMKTTRIYLPLLVIALLPSLFGHDLLSHVGGFLGGVLGALVVPPHPQRVPWETDGQGSTARP